MTRAEDIAKRPRVDSGLYAIMAASCACVGSTIYSGCYFHHRLSGEYRFIVPLPPNLTNRRSGKSHWRVIHREKKGYVNALDAMQVTNLLPPPPTEPMQAASVESVMYLGNYMDDDNALARHKWLLDWLKSRGYIADDRKKNITWKSLPEQHIDRLTPRIEITLSAA